MNTKKKKISETPGKTAREEKRDQRTVRLTKNKIAVVNSLPINN